MKVINMTVVYRTWSNVVSDQGQICPWPLAPNAHPIVNLTPVAALLESFLSFRYSFSCPLPSSNTGQRTYLFVCRGGARSSWVEEGRSIVQVFIHSQPTLSNSPHLLPDLPYGIHVSDSHADPFLAYPPSCCRIPTDSRENPDFRLIISNFGRDSGEMGNFPSLLEYCLGTLPRPRFRRDWKPFYRVFPCFYLLSWSWSWV